VAAYYVVSEALTNAARHAASAQVRVQARLDERVLRVEVRDDGPGGADPERGSGLLALRDRVEAIGGSFTVDSRPQMGTTLTALLPVGDDSG
jgi:signal transduction histidine kinase